MLNEPVAKSVIHQSRDHSTFGHRMLIVESTVTIGSEDNLKRFIEPSIGRIRARSTAMKKIQASDGLIVHAFGICMIERSITLVQTKYQQTVMDGFEEVLILGN